MQNTDEAQFFKECLETTQGPPDILQWVKSRLEGSRSHKFPILFKNTRHVCKIVHKFEGNTKKKYFKAIQTPSKFSNLNDEDKNGISTPFHRVFLHIFDQSILNKKMWLSKSLSQLKNTSKRPVDLIFLYLIKNKISPLYIDCLAPSISIILKEILRNIRVNMPNFIYNPAIPKRAYLLIQREDIYMNLRIYPHSKALSQKQNRKKVQSAFGQASYYQDNHSSFLNIDDTKFNDTTFSPFRNRDEDQHIQESKLNIIDPQLLAQLNINLHYEKNDLLFKETRRLLDINENIIVKQKYIEHLPEDRLEAESQKIAQNFAIRRLSVLVGLGAFLGNTEQS